MLILGVGQHATGTLAPKDADGNPATVDGVPEWSSSNPSTVTVSPSADGLSCVVTGVGIGDSQVGVVADADLGSGVREITTVDDVSVKAKEAMTLGIEWGPVEG